jgi:transcriptional regulator CtsR
VLGSAELSKSVQSVVVSRSNLSAELFHRVPKKQHYVIATRFGPDYPREFDVVCHMSGDMVRYLHDMLKQFGAIL